MISRIDRVFGCCSNFSSKIESICRFLGYNSAFNLIGGSMYFPKSMLVSGLIVICTGVANSFADNVNKSQVYKVANVGVAQVLNVRQRPSINSPVLLQLPADSRWLLKRTSTKQGRWQKVVWGVNEGWVNNRYVNLDQNASRFLEKHRQCVKQNPENSMCCGVSNSGNNRNHQTHTEIRTFRVVNVPEGQSLNVRMSGRASAKKISNIPHNAVGIVKFPGQQKRHGREVWQKIRWNGRNGWVNARFLKYDPIVSDYRNIVQQACF